MHWSCCAPAHNKDFFVFSTERSEVSIEEVTAWMLDDGNAPQQDPAGTGNCKHPKKSDTRKHYCNYAPNFEEVAGAYWFRVVRVCVHAAVRSPKTVYVRVLKFHIWIPHGKIVDTHFFSCPSYLPFWSYAPLKKSKRNLMHAESYEPCMLGF